MSQSRFVVPLLLMILAALITGCGSQASRPNQITNQAVTKNRPTKTIKKTSSWHPTHSSLSSKNKALLKLAAKAGLKGLFVLHGTVLAQKSEHTYQQNPSKKVAIVNLRYRNHMMVSESEKKVTGGGSITTFAKTLLKIGDLPSKTNVTEFAITNMGGSTNFISFKRNGIYYTMGSHSMTERQVVKMIANLRYIH